MILAQLPGLDLKRLESLHGLVVPASVFGAEGPVLLQRVTLPNRKGHVLRLVTQGIA